MDDPMRRTWPISRAPDCTNRASVEVRTRPGQRTHHCCEWWRGESEGARETRDRRRRQRSAALRTPARLRWHSQRGRTKQIEPKECDADERGVVERVEFHPRHALQVRIEVQVKLELFEVHPVS